MVMLSEKIPGLSSLFESAASLSVGLQSVQENLPENVKSTWGGLYFQSLKEGVNARIGLRRTIRTKTGPMEVVELDTLGDSANVTKVRCCATDKEFALKRIEAPMEGEEPGSASPASMKVTISLEALKTLVDRTELITALPESPYLVCCAGTQADNSGKTHAQMLLFELCEESLTDFLARSGGMLKVQEVLRVLEDVAAGLHCLHTTEGKPVIHGSVRPDHILRGESGLWKLGGFGAVQDAEGLDVSSDVLQLGILIFQLLFGNSEELEQSGLDTGVALPVPHLRPKDTLEGRMCLLLRWMLASDPSKRPTAKQVGFIVESLRSMPAVEILQAMPLWVREAAQKTCEELKLKVLCEAISNIDGSDRRILANRYGEEALLNPTLLPEATRTKALNADQSAHMRDLPIFLGCGGDGSPDLTQAPLLVQCVDLMDMAQDLIDLPEKTESKQPTQPTLIDMFDPINAPVVHTQCPEPPDLL